MFAVSYDTLTASNIAGIDASLQGNTHEEADTLMILHAIDIARINPFRELCIFSPDTDVLLLLNHYYPQLPTVTMFYTGNHIISVGAAYEVLGPQKCLALLGFHAFTGCDQTSKFHGKSKLTCWKVFMKSEDDVIEAFQNIGENDEAGEATINKLEKYVIDLFCDANFLPAYTLADARWHLYTKLQDCDKLPPTRAALRFKVLRSHLMCLIWKSSSLPESEGT